jgi:hypothetical protein
VLSVPPSQADVAAGCGQDEPPGRPDPRRRCNCAVAARLSAERTAARLHQAPQEA